MTEIIKNISELLNQLCIKLKTLCKKDSNRFIEFATQPDVGVLNSHIQLSKQKGDKNVDVFEVQICGSIYTSDNLTNTGNTKLIISIVDVTDGRNKSQRVLAANKQWSNFINDDSSAFSYNTDLGKLIHKITIISDWTVVARLPVDWLILPRAGYRQLQFEVVVLTADGKQKLASTQSDFTYENENIGYLEIQENIERTKILAVALAFAVGAADGNLKDCEIELIRRWANDNLTENSNKSSKRADKKLNKALNKTVTFFRNGHRLNVNAICSEVAEISPNGQLYDILELCLKVAQAKGTVAAEELTLLKNMTSWLNINTDKSHLMMQKMLPIDIHEVMDVETVLGITSDMSKEKARKHLNNEYRKWNSRVTHSNPHIQTQADQMLQLIAQARSQYITK